MAESQKKLFNTKKLAKSIVESTIYDKNTSTLFVSNPAISFEVLKGLAKKHGFTMGQTKKGEYVSIPLGDKYKNFDILGLYEAFLDSYTLYDKNYSMLLNAYHTFDLMDENLPEITLMLDTYVAEVLSQGFLYNPLSIKISDSQAQDLVDKVLYKNKIYQKLPNITRSIAKYGNLGMVLSYPYIDKWLEENKDNENLDFKQIDVKEDLNIRIVNPKYFKVSIDEYYNPVNYETENEPGIFNNNSKSVLNNKIWQPWQFVHFLISDDTTEPYGKSLLWSMRSAFDQLTTLEALLGISRASKIQRLVFYVPIPTNTALTDAYGYLNEFKSMYLNSIFTDAPGLKNGRKIPGAASILTLPMSADGKKVEVDHIEANIDLSSVEDVEYFLDKILRNSKLPKGYLVGEDVITTAQTLEAQDLKLKRALIPLKKALVDGMMYLVENILAHAGYNVETLDVKVTLNEPVQILSEVMERYKDSVEFLMLAKEANPQLTTINSYQILTKLGIPNDIAALIMSNTNINTSTNVEDLAGFISKQRVSLRNNKAIKNDEDVEESIISGISSESKVFLNENSALKEQLNEVHSILKSKQGNRSLKESLLKPKNKIN